MLGIDVARAVAIVGMVMVHFGPYEPDTTQPLGWLYRTSHGRASFLFVLLAGVGITLLAGDRSPARLTRLWTTAGWRAVIFLPLGLWLQGLDTPVAVILQFYALYTLLAAALVHLPDRWLLGLAAGWAVAGPLLLLVLRIGDPTLGARQIVTDASDPVELARNLLVTGYYPVLTWAPPLLAGLWIGRRDLRDPRTAWWLLAGGAGLAAAAYSASEVARRALDLAPTLADPGWDLLALAEGHSSTPLNVLGATGTAVAVLAACLLLTAALPRLTWPLAATGQLAFTIYVGHLLVLHLAPDLLVARDSVTGAATKVAWFTVVVVAFAAAWRAVLPRGPLEAVLHLPTLATGRRAPPAGR